MGPLSKTGEISQSATLWLAVFPMGFLFGYALQRAGMTDARKIAGVFYLRDVDVPVVMFTAIIFAMLGLWGLGLFGVLDIARVYLLPTYLWPMAVGGLIFGIGMAMGGYCPGTALASMVTGRLDALMFALGVFVGTLVFTDPYSLWEGLYNSGSLGVYRLDQVFGIGLGPTMLLVALVAIGGSVGLRRLQQYFWHNVEGPGSAGVRWMVGAAVVLAAALALFSDRSFFAITNTAGSMGGWTQAWEDPYESVIVDPLTAGRLAYRYQDRLRCFDLRESPRTGGELPGASPATAAELAEMPLDPTTVVLAFGRQGDPQVRDTVGDLRKRGLRAFAVAGGFEALKPYYLDPLSPRLKAGLSAGELKELEAYRTLCSPRMGPRSGAPQS